MMTCRRNAAVPESFDEVLLFEAEDIQHAGVVDSRIFTFSARNIPNAINRLVQFLSWQDGRPWSGMQRSSKGSSQDNSSRREFPLPTSLNYQRMKKRQSEQTTTYPATEFTLSMSAQAISEFDNVSAA